MVSDIKEPPFRLNFQAASLHSGSVSFGRFEKEAICWERRSSFSNNRYLEEVEKYSKPGSVTEKKAYFEAHFRKRALMKQTTSGSQNGTVHQRSENDNLETMNYEYDFESFRERSYSARFDESPVCSIREKEFEEPECAGEHTGTSYSEPQHEPPCIPESEQVSSQETYQIEVENSASVNNEPEIGVTENHSAEAGTLDMTIKPANLSAIGQLAEEDRTVSSEEPSNQVKTASQPKEIKCNIKSQVTGAQGNRNTPDRASKDLASKLSRRGADVSLKSKTENKLSETPLATTRTSNRMQKHEVPHKSMIKAHHLNKSADLESRRRPVYSLHSASEKAVPKAYPSANWPKRDVSSTKPGTKQNVSAFSFKSDARAEKRKEFYMKLEEKMHRKDSEKHQLCAKGQGTSSHIKSSKPRSKSSSSGIETSERSPSRSDAGSDKAPSASEPLKKSDPRHVSEATSFPQTVPSRSRAHSAAQGVSRPAQTGAANLMTRKKDRLKEMHINLEKDKVSEESKVIKGQKIEGKPKMGPGRSNTSVIRKDMKGGHLGSSSSSAVGVAS